MRPLTEGAYKLFVSLLNGSYRKPVKERSLSERNAVNLFWRRKSGLSLKRHNDQELLFYEGKKVLKKEDLTGKVEKSVRTMKGCGARSIAHSLKHRYEGISEETVRSLAQLEPWAFVRQVYK